MNSDTNFVAIIMTFIILGCCFVMVMAGLAYFEIYAYSKYILIAFGVLCAIIILTALSVRAEISRARRRKRQNEL